jgi:hypothetical protein
MLLLRAPLAVCFRCLVNKPLGGPRQTAVAQLFPFRALIDVLDRIVAKLISRKASIGLMPTVDDRNVGLHMTSQQPSQELSTSVGLISC